MAVLRSTLSTHEPSQEEMGVSAILGTVPSSISSRPIKDPDGIVRQVRYLRYLPYLTLKINARYLTLAVGKVPPAMYRASRVLYNWL
jgi:hypothetical protein